MNLSIADIGRVCHEANRALQLIQGNPGIPVSLSWEDESDELRDSVTQGVRGVLDGATPEESHEGWCAHRRAHGWEYGSVKDPVARTHPCLVPYAELPAEQRAKDDLFAAIVRALAGPRG